MRILSLELQNIKSYHEPTRIDFTAGLNAVCGLNGSGKTTVLEAIGYALFDFLPYNQQAFVREGEKSGTIRLCFVAEDGRPYEIVRKIGSGAHYYVTDLENDFKLADRGPDVLAWVQVNALGVDGQTDLKAFFKNAVGVPQGLMTADFLVAPSARKSTFDPLLRVEEYRKAFDSLLDTVNHLRDRSNEVDREIARLEAETDRLPSLQERLDENRARVAVGTAARDSLATSLLTLEARRSELDGLQRQLMQLEGDVKGARYDVDRFTDAHRHASESLQSAQAAHRAVTESEPGYRLFKQADATLKELDERRAARDGLRASLAKVKGELDGTRRQIARLEAELTSTQQAGMAAAQLAEDVTRQIDLEREQHELNAVLGGLAELDKRHRATVDELAQVQRQATEREARLTEALTAQREAAALPAARDRVRELWTALALLEPMEAQLSVVKAQGKTLKDQAMRLTDEVKQRNELMSACDVLHPQADRFEAVQSQMQELRDERVRVRATLEYQEVARRNLEQRTCPLLEQECPVVAADSSVMTRFSGRTSELHARSRELERTVDDLTAELARCRAAATQVQTLEVRSAKLEGSEARLVEIRRELDECIVRHDDLQAHLQQQAGLRDRHTIAVAEEQRLQARRELGQLVGELESVSSSEIERLRGLREELKLLDEQRADTAVLRERLGVLAAELIALEDPRQRQNTYLGQAARQAEVAASLERELKRRVVEDEAYRKFSEDLQPFESLDAEIAQQRDLLATHRPAYETYLQQGKEAAMVSEREAAVRDAAHHLEAAQQRERVVSAAHEAAAKQYAAGEHAELQRLCQAAGEELSAKKSMLVRDQQELKTLEDEFAHLERQRKKLSERQAERGELGTVADALAFIRDTIKAAGPAVTETLLAHISQGANDIFSEIMDDHTVELRWDRDYEVLAQRGAEIRKFNQLSGGEQMSAALAVRLALLKEMSEVDFAFFDEPTQNMDGERRTNLANQISEIRGFDQLIVISHDDTFEHHTDNMIRLVKSHEETRLDSD